jgi:beta-glucosidase
LTPEFAFGFGLSYTTFEYSNIKVKNANAKVGDFVEVSFDMKNSGKVAGEEVAQLYLSTGKILPNVQMPVKQLRGFEKVFLNAGETKRITFTLTPEDLYIYNETLKSYQVPEGQFFVQIGGSSDNAAVKTEFTLTKAAAKPDLSVVNIRTMPTFPKEVQEVVFLASVINNGTAQLKKGNKFAVRFYVDGKEVANFVSKSTSIPIGGMEMVCAKQINSKNWKASNGVFQVIAKIEVLESLDLNKGNNLCEGELVIPNGRVIPKEIAKAL